MLSVFVALFYVRSFYNYFTEYFSHKRTFPMPEKPGFCLFKTVKRKEFSNSPLRVTFLDQTVYHLKYV